MKIDAQESESGQLRLIELYSSLQGESTEVGRPCTFIRLAGCDLRCVWCDSAFTFTGGDWWSLSDIMDAVKAEGLPLVELTGGEPLLQPNSPKLLKMLVDAGYEVLLETSGSQPIDAIPEQVVVIMDLKAPGSGEVDKNHLPNLAFLRPQDQLKCVVASEEDYLWCRDTVSANALFEKCQVLFSPVWESVSPRELAAWVLRDRLNARVQIQLHKVIWPPDARGV